MNGPHLQYALFISFPGFKTNPDAGLMRTRAVLLLLALAAPPLLAAGAPLLPSLTYPVSKGQETLIVTLSVWLGGSSVRNASAPTAKACIEACRLDRGCEWVNWCPLQARAADRKVNKPVSFAAVSGGGTAAAPPCTKSHARASALSAVYMIAGGSGATLAAVCSPPDAQAPLVCRRAATMASARFLTKGAACSPADHRTVAAHCRRQ